MPGGHGRHGAGAQLRGGLPTRNASILALAWLGSDSAAPLRLHSAAAAPRREDGPAAAAAQQVRALHRLREAKWAARMQPLGPLLEGYRCDIVGIAHCIRGVTLICLVPWMLLLTIFCRLIFISPGGWVDVTQSSSCSLFTFFFRARHRACEVGGEATAPYLVVRMTGDVVGVGNQLPSIATGQSSCPLPAETSYPKESTCC